MATHRVSRNAAPPLVAVVNTPTTVGTLSRKKIENVGHLAYTRI